MNLSHFNIAKKELAALLEKLEMLKSKGYKNINEDGVSDAFKKAAQKGTYFDAYKAAIQNFDFDILLFDDSFFQFEFQEIKPHTVPSIRYAFFQNPNEFVEYQVFLQEVLDTNYEESGEYFREEYEQHLAEQQINTSSTVIRYDVQPNDHQPLIHAVAHIHIGHNNNIRIPTDKLLTPFSFALFVLKHTYYHRWESWIMSENYDLKAAMKKIKNTSEKLPPSYWAIDEQDELFLT